MGEKYPMAICGKQLLSMMGPAGWIDATESGTKTSRFVTQVSPARRRRI